MPMNADLSGHVDDVDSCYGYVDDDGEDDYENVQCEDELWSNRDVQLLHCDSAGQIVEMTKHWYYCRRRNLEK